MGWVSTPQLVISSTNAGAFGFLAGAVMTLAEIDRAINCLQFSVLQAEKIDDNDCSEGSVIGGILGAGIALSTSRGKDRFWAVPAGGTAGALIGCQMDGG